MNSSIIVALFFSGALIFCILITLYRLIYDRFNITRLNLPAVWTVFAVLTLVTIPYIVYGSQQYNEYENDLKSRGVVTDWVVYQDEEIYKLRAYTTIEGEDKGGRSDYFCNNPEEDIFDGCMEEKIYENPIGYVVDLWYTKNQYQNSTDTYKVFFSGRNYDVFPYLAMTFSAVWFTSLIILSMEWTKMRQTAQDSYDPMNDV